ncbi:MAG: Homoserine kinase [Elusimicrobia bacterium ADurb.Bin231]|nr:MAG: Homoserine kinase [Elusimicrobia bacterium ADurb.Bin231]
MKLKLKIPATTANFGSGFDVFGASLRIYNEIEMTAINGKHQEIHFEILGEGRKTLPVDKSNIVYGAMKKVFDTLHFTHYALHIRLINNIPLSRGLGSSAAARIGGLVAANKLCGGRISDEEIIKIAANLEGHPDNVAPAFIGGLCVCNYDGADVKCVKFQMPADLKAVLCIPDFEVSTNMARKILPKKILHRDAVFNLSRSALFLSAIIQKKYDLLSIAMEDKLHQPYRKKLIPCLDDVFSAAMRNGAYGVCVSGSGSTLLAIAARNMKTKCERIGRSMQKAFCARGIESKYIICDFCNKGVLISK